MTDDATPLQYARDDPLVARHQLARAAAAGTQQRVARGVYLSSESWGSLRDSEKYLRKVIAVSETRQAPVVLSFWSAAVVHGLPIVGRWPDRVHITVGPTSGGRSNGQVVRHAVPLGADEVVEVNGLRVTSMPRTVLDMASLTTPLAFLDAVVLTDRALHRDRWGRRAPLVTREELHTAYGLRLPFRGHAQAKRVLDFAVAESDSVLESVSRVNMRIIGCPSPVLQQEFTDHRGLIGYSEFYWPEYALVGESDGRMKYLDPAYRHGRTLDELVYAEKVRADRLRAIGLRVARWDWDTACQPEALRRQLAAEGLPVGRPRRPAAGTGRS
jgi:hypothetical protein